MMRSWGPRARIISVNVREHKCDPSNWIVIPELGAVPQPPWLGFDGYIEPGSLESDDFGLSVREVILMARWRLQRAGISLAEAQRTSARLDEQSKSETSRERSAIYYFAVIRSLLACHGAENAALERFHLNAAIKALEEWGDPAHVLAHEQRRRARSRRKEVEAHEVAAFARASGIPQGGKLPKAFEIEASTRFKVDRGTIRRRLKKVGYIP